MTTLPTLYTQYYNNYHIFTAVSGKHFVNITNTIVRLGPHSPCNKFHILQHKFLHIYFNGAYWLLNIKSKHVATFTKQGNLKKSVLLIRSCVCSPSTTSLYYNITGCHTYNSNCTADRAFVLLHKLRHEICNFCNKKTLICFVLLWLNNYAKIL